MMATVITPVMKLEGHRGPVMHVVGADDDSLLSTSSEDSTVRLWDVRVRRDRAVRCVCVGDALALRGSPVACSCLRGAWALFAGCSGVVGEFDLRGADVVVRATAPSATFRAAPAKDDVTEISCQCVAASPLLAVSDDSGAVTILRSSDGTVHKRLAGRGRNRGGGHSNVSRV
jgi:WD40 repeat protein